MNDTVTTEWPRATWERAAPGMPLFLRLHVWLVSTDPQERAMYVRQIRAQYMHFIPGDVWMQTYGA